MEKIKQIFLYLDDQLSQIERKKFEESLLNDEELLSLYNQHKNNMNELKSLQNIEVDSFYFSNLTARFRDKYQSKRKFYLNSKFAIGIAVSAIIIMIYLNPFSENSDSFLIGDYNSEELSYYSINIDNTIGFSNVYDLNEEQLDLLNSSITEELGLSESNFKRLISPTQPEIYRMVEELSEQEMEQVYNDLSKKTIL
ncbi:MAG: hypothetical protein KGZ85_05470 [Ignavibacterium sp.]|nr:hypothetical protein [Ignavibacterium sp.]